MLNEKKLQARNLFFQTELTKTQIAGMLNISRRSLSYWVKEGDWDRLKESSRHLPAILADNCYHIFGHLTELYMSERRISNPVSYKEINGLHKLTLTIKNLKNRSTVNESMEMFGFFMDSLNNKNAKLAAEVMPYIDEYVTARAGIRPIDLVPDHCTGVAGRIPWTSEDNSEALIDQREAFYDDPDTIRTFEKYNIPMPCDEEISTLPLHDSQVPSSIIEREEADRLEAYNQRRREKEKMSWNYHCAAAASGLPAQSAPALPAREEEQILSTIPQADETLPVTQMPPEELSPDTAADTTPTLENVPTEIAHFDPACATFAQEFQAGDNVIT